MLIKMRDILLLKKGCTEWVIWDGISLSFIFENNLYFSEKFEKIQTSVKCDKNK